MLLRFYTKTVSIILKILLLKKVVYTLRCIIIKWKDKRSKCSKFTHSMINIKKNIGVIKKPISVSKYRKLMPKQIIKI